MPEATYSRRRAPSRGLAALEFALVMPVFFGLIGLCVTLGLGTLARFQMMDFTHFAVRTCVANYNTLQNLGGVGGCIANQIAASTPSFVQVCSLAAPQVTAPTAVDTQFPPIYRVTASLSCSFATGVPLLSLLPGGAQAFTITASSTATTLPRWP